MVASYATGVINAECVCVVQKTGRALQALKRFTCLQRQSANGLSTGKSSSSSGHGSVISDRSLDEVKVTDDTDLSEVRSRSFTRISQHQDSNCDEFNRDSGIPRSNSAYGQTSNDDVDDDDDDDDDGVTEPEDDVTGNGLPHMIISPRSPPTRVSQADEFESKMSAADGLERSGETGSPVSSVEVVNGKVLESEPSLGSGKSESLTTVTNCSEHATSTAVPGRTSSAGLVSTSSADISSSGDVGSATSNSDTTDSEVPVLEASTSAQSAVTPDSMDLSRTSSSVTASTPERSSSMPEKPETTTSSASFVVSAGRLSTVKGTSAIIGNQNPQKTSSVVPVRSISTTASTPGRQDLPTTASTPGKLDLPRSVSTTASTPGRQDLPTTASTPGKLDLPRSVSTTASTPGRQEPPRRRVMNTEFLTASKNSSRPKKPPMFIRKMRNVNVVKGQTAKFEVRVDGNPAPSVRWLKNGVELAIDRCKYSVERISEDGRWSLLIADCTEDDMAEYGCTAVSDLGKVTSRSQLLVEPEGTGQH